MLAGRTTLAVFLNRKQTQSWYTNRRGILLREQWTTFYKRMALKKEAQPSSPQPGQTDRQTGLCQHTSFRSVFHQPRCGGTLSEKKKAQLSELPEKAPWLLSASSCKEWSMSKGLWNGRTPNPWCPFSKSGNSQPLASSCSVCRNRGSFCPFTYHTTHHSNTRSIMC